MNKNTILQRLYDLGHITFEELVFLLNETELRTHSSNQPILKPSHIDYYYIPGIMPYPTIPNPLVPDVTPDVWY